MQYDGERDGIYAVAALQADLARADNACRLLGADWESKRGALRTRALRALARIAAHIVGTDTLTGRHRTDTRNARLGDADARDLELARLWRLWLCAHDDTDFAGWAHALAARVRTDTEHGDSRQLAERVVRLARRAPRIALGLAPRVDLGLAELEGALGLDATLTPDNTQVALGWIAPMTARIGHALGARIGQHGDTDSHTDTEHTQTHTDAGRAARAAAAAEIPPFSLDFRASPDGGATGVDAEFPALEFSPRWWLHTEDPDGKMPGKACTRAELAKALAELCDALPPVPAVDIPPWRALRLATQELETPTTGTTTTPAQTARVRSDNASLSSQVRTCRSTDAHTDPLSEFRRLWAGDFREIPIPEVCVEPQPDADWVAALETLAGTCVPELDLPLGFYGQLVGHTDTANTGETRAALTQKQQTALEQVDALLGAALETTATETRNPLRVHAAWARWGEALADRLVGADDYVPAVVAAIADANNARTEKLTQALRWAADAAQWAGENAQTTPDHIWACFSKAQLRIAQLPALPVQHSGSDLSGDIPVQQQPQPQGYTPTTIE